MVKGRRRDHDGEKTLYLSFRASPSVLGQQKVSCEELLFLSFTRRKEVHPFWQRINSDYSASNSSSSSS